MPHDRPGGVTAALRASRSFEAIGTHWRIETDRPLDPDTAGAVDALIERYDRTWSRFRPDSAVRALARGGSAALGPEADALLPLLLDLAARTGGAVTPLIGESLEHLGYDARLGFAARDGWRPAPDAAALHVAGGVVTLETPAVIDVGAAGKGRLVDLVARLLADAGHDDLLVDASGDLAAAGAPVSVALEHPFDATAAIGTVQVHDAALAGSAVQRRAWTALDGRRLHHVLDGRTGRPVDAIAATWVLAADAMTADALATALFFAPPETFEGAYDFRFVRMASDGRAHWSPDWPGEVFTA